jgi:hypothetical protein
VGFEPTNGGFADLSLGPLGYRAKQSSIANHLLGRSLPSRVTPSRQILQTTRRQIIANEPHQTTQNQRFLKHACTNRPYFVAIGEATLASRKNRAASSGGVGLM